MSLQSLLNPAPADESSSTDMRQTSLPRPQNSQSPTTFHPTRSTDAHDQGGLKSDAAQALASLSTSTAPPPIDWATASHGAMQSPTAPRQAEMGSPHMRRMSLYGDANADIGNPLRKMSSPSLEQYHVGSRSPEQQRRASIMQDFDPGFTLPPIQIATVSQATSQEHPASQPTQPKGTKETDNIPESTQTPLEDLQVLTAPVKSESSASLKDAIPAFVPVASLKPEHSAHQNSPLREASVPVPTTEDMPSATNGGRKRPAPKGAPKKGTANSVRKGPPSKKRKIESGAAAIPASKSKPRAGSTLLGKKTASTSATPLNSSPAPRSTQGSSPARSLESDEVENDESDGEEQDDEEDQGTPDPDADLYCICRRPDTGTFMIGCDGGCDDWFHGKCVKIEEKNKNLIDRYICPRCEKGGRGVTTWKRMCRRSGCRMPARVGGKKNKGENASKYCSDDCGTRYFSEIIGKGRSPAGIAAIKRSTRKKSGSGADMLGLGDEIVGSKGGVVTSGELKALVTSVPDINEFKRLGDGVLSPPATPSPANTKNGMTNGDSEVTESVLTSTEAERMAEIAKRKIAMRERHGLLKDRIKFITMAKQAALRLAQEKEMKPKEMCGYDSRISWTEERFAQWRASRIGSEALKTGTLEVESANGTDADGDNDMESALDDEDEAPTEACTKRKCARHYDWSKLALDDTRFEMNENSESMRSLEREEKEIRERAGLRARELKAGGLGGSVEIHDPSETIVNGTDADMPGDEMAVDALPPAEAPLASGNGKVIVEQEAASTRNGANDQVAAEIDGGIEANATPVEQANGQSVDMMETTA